MDKCFVCGRHVYKADCHHLFQGPFRKKADRLGLVVKLCRECHTGDNGAHFNAELMQALHEYGQKKAMQEQGWTVEEFIKQFGRNYLEVD